MVEVAREKFVRLRPGYGGARFFARSALGPVPGPGLGLAGGEKREQEAEEEEVAVVVAADGGRMGRDGRYDTVVQTMGLCSTPQPAELLRRLGALTRPDGGRVLLLEHGRGYYGWVNWVLDRTAGAHAAKHGCWWNRDVGALVRESGLVVERVERRHLGTLWLVELRPKREGEGT